MPLLAAEQQLIDCAYDHYVDDERLEPCFFVLHRTDFNVIFPILVELL